MMIVMKVPGSMTFPCGSETSQQEESVYNRKLKAVLLFFGRGLGVVEQVNLISPSF